MGFVDGEGLAEFAGAVGEVVAGLAASSGVHEVDAVVGFEGADEDPLADACGLGDEVDRVVAADLVDVEVPGVHVHRFDARGAVAVVGVRALVLSAEVCLDFDDPSRCDAFGRFVDESVAEEFSGDFLGCFGKILVKHVLSTFDL